MLNFCDAHKGVVYQKIDHPDLGRVPYCHGDERLPRNSATRAVKTIRPLPSNGTFWTAKGSKRKLPDDEAVRAAVIYVVKKQPNPLATWFAPAWQDVLNEWESTGGVTPIPLN